MSKRPRLRTAVRLALAAFKRHNASRFGAALAFYIVFCIAPTMLIAIAIAGRIFGEEQAQRHIIGWIGGSFGSAASSAVAAMIDDAAPLRAGWLATTLGVMSLYFGLSGVYRQIKDALQTIWREKRREEAGAIVELEKKFASMLLVAAAGVIVLLSVLADATIAATGRYAASRLVGGEWLWHATQLLGSTIVLTVLFAVVFSYLTPARVTWRNVRVGAAVTAFLFVIGKFGLGFYLGKAAVGSAFRRRRLDRGGAVVVLLVGADLLLRPRVHVRVRAGTGGGVMTRGKRLQPERRSGTRVVTLKNAFWATLAVIVLFALFSLYIELRGAGDSEYGRLYERRSDTAQPTTTT